MKKFFLFSFIVTLLFFFQIDNWLMETPLQKEVELLIPKGASLKQVAFQLKEENVISKPWLFVLYARFKGVDKKVHAGEYQFMPKITMDEVMKKISTGQVYLRKLTIPEGFTTGQILHLIESNELLSGETTLNFKEGELLPETYSFVLGDTKDSVLLQAKKAMDEFVADVWSKKNPSLPYKNINDMLTFASIVEKETSIPEERGLVASVFLNRLRIGMRLQTDPTVIYALTNGEFDLGRALFRGDLKVDSPYNTYRNYGLPPAPICNPGKGAILATMNPDTSDYLYFVASGNGGHNFAKTLRGHNNNVRKWKKNR